MDDQTMIPADDQQPHQPQEPSQDQLQEDGGSFRLDLYFWVQALTLALVFLVLTFTLLGRVIRVVGSSMVPTLHEGDLMLLQSVGYTPQQGDVVVLRKESFMVEPVVKRVIAVGGQHVTVDYDAHCVYVDGTALDEPYINEVMQRPFSSAMTVLDVTVPEGSVYVLGDNRNHSSDSRHEDLATIDQRYILGRVLCVLVPLDHFKLIQ